MTSRPDRSNNCRTTNLPTFPDAPNTTIFGLSGTMDVGGRSVLVCVGRSTMLRCFGDVTPSASSLLLLLSSSYPEYGDGLRERRAALRPVLEAAAPPLAIAVVGAAIAVVVVLLVPRRSGVRAAADVFTKKDRCHPRSSCTKKNQNDIIQSPRLSKEHQKTV